MARGSARVATGNGVAFTTSRLLAPALPAWRSRCVLFVISTLFALLAARAAWLQAVSEGFLQEQGAARYLRTLELPASRGRILDRQGRVLAVSIPARTVWANPGHAAGADPASLRELARLLEMDEGTVRARLASDRSFVYLKRQVDVETARRILALGIPGIATREDTRRHYPEGGIAAHLVGFTDIEDAGQEGMELARQQDLLGRPGARRVIRDRLGHLAQDLGTMRPAIDGRDLSLSIDRNLQHIARTHLAAALERHQAKAGGIVVLDVRSGEVLALANLPDYDPNDRGRLSGAQLRNRVLTDTFEPGSVVKPFTIALALEQGIATPHTLVETGGGRLRIGSASIGDASRHGTLTVSQVLEKSSNIGTARLALQMRPESMWTLFTEVGFGQAPDLGFPGSVAGRLRPHHSWRPIEQATISYGHGLSTSLMQLACAYLVFARDGEIVPVTLLKRHDAPAARQVIPGPIAREVRAMMERAAGPEGTASRARVAGYRVAGKTSTAHKVEAGRYVNRYVASFVGLAPVSDPRIIVAVMVDEPTAGGHYGGLVAAPVFAAVTQDVLRALNVHPDAPVGDIIAPDQP
ncbi:penicillin-binding protein 2 [Massilia oculi]|uniref:Peptidoglycan D,D-transpeptidase FtsI n=1 Tax=Massilia hydrophila TaxID=3044279 RepID=A0ABS7Y9L8_9BURK|nr:penicillin-binding protein 2 [Massilia oculi]MCA1856373.1 penicillin-binding protein 2 [Massilia oculi]